MHWVGDGFAVQTVFFYGDGAERFSPFLMLDYGRPREFAPSDVPRGVGEHPHRGFETVTIAYQGEISHRDSSGGGGTIGPGDVQWMTAGGGLVHEEKFSRDFSARGGVLEMVQLWVNLPAAHKLTPPRYQDLQASEFPMVSVPGGTASLIAGELGGQNGPARTFTPIRLCNLDLAADATTQLELTEGHPATVLVRRGELVVEGRSVRPSEVAVFDRPGDALVLETREPTAAVLMSGEPIDEPIAGYGPFVMNTEAEIRQAIRDFQEGRMGRLTRRLAPRKT